VGIASFSFLGLLANAISYARNRKERIEEGDGKPAGNELVESGWR
jgi:hypothetical protein